MEFKYIEAFLSVVETGSFTQAADSMHTSQPTITSRIQKLEQEVGAVLFTRNGGKKAILTAEGKKVHPYFKEAFQLILKGSEVLKTDKPGFGKIQLSCPNHMGQFILPNVLKSLYEYFPNVEFNVKVNITSQIVEDVKKGVTDIGLIYLDIEEENDFYTISPIVVEKTVLVASHNHRLTQHNHIKILDLKDEKFFVFAKTANNTVRIDQFLHEHGLKEYNSIEIKNLEWIKIMVQSGLGISFLQKNTVEDELKNHRLKELTLTEPLPNNPISIIIRNDVPQDIRYTIIKTVKELFHM